LDRIGVSIRCSGGAGELGSAERLQNVARSARPHGSQNAGRDVDGGQGDAGGLGQFLANGVDDILAAHSRQAQVDESHVGLFAPGQYEPFLARGCCAADFEAVCSEDLCD
jgi:hypothetical protein